jgi:hypothetical protein
VFRFQSLPWQRSIHDRAYRSDTTRCGIPYQVWMRRGARLAALRQFSMQDTGFEVPRIYLPGSRVNKGRYEGPGLFGTQSSGQQVGVA